MVFDSCWVFHNKSAVQGLILMVNFIVVWFKYWKDAVWINDKFCFDCRQTQKILQIAAARRHSWKVKLRKVGWKVIGRYILRSKGSNKGQIKDKAESIATEARFWKRFSSYWASPAMWSTHKTKIQNLTYFLSHEHSQTDKTVRLKWSGKPEGQGAGQSKRFVLFV